MTDNVYLDVKEAAAFLKLSASTLNKKRVSGGGPVYRKFGRKMVRYLKSDLVSWAERDQRTSTSDAKLFVD